jgi:hypothetical protein
MTFPQGIALEATRVIREALRVGSAYFPGYASYPHFLRLA